MVWDETPRGCLCTKPVRMIEDVEVPAIMVAIFLECRFRFQSMDRQTLAYFRQMGNML